MLLSDRSEEFVNPAPWPFDPRGGRTDPVEGSTSGARHTAENTKGRHYSTEALSGSAAAVITGDEAGGAAGDTAGDTGRDVDGAERLTACAQAGSSPRAVITSDASDSSDS